MSFQSFGGGDQWSNLRFGEVVLYTAFKQTIFVHRLEKYIYFMILERNLLGQYVRYIGKFIY